LHQNPVQGVKGTLNQRTAFYLGIKRKSRGRWGFLYFDLKFGEQNYFTLYFSPNFGLRESKVFGPLEV